MTDRDILRSKPSEARKLDRSAKRGDAMQTRQVIMALGALAQETRLQIFRLLVEYGAQGLPAGAIAEAVGVPPATLSFHLHQLLHARLVKQRRESRSLIYSANFDGMNALLAYLTENCCSRDAARCASPEPRASATGKDRDAPRRAVRRAGR
jgi:ArsR family transcriptional regulator